MSDLVLLADPDAAAPFAWRSRGPVRVAEVRRAVHVLAAQLVAGATLVNLCEDRLNFTVALLAAAAAGGTTVMPADRKASTLERVQAEFPGSRVVRDAAGRDDLGVEEAFAAASEASGPVHIDGAAARIVAYTSGSTGVGSRIEKTFGGIWETARHTAQQFSIDPRSTVTATVPAQHMYGLETSVMLPLTGNAGMNVQRPLLPADVAAALARTPAPRILVTTPVHLRALVRAATALPEITFAISATAPLSEREAAEFEAFSDGAPVYEIYGCTEVGSFATRRTTEGPEWQLLPGMTLGAVGEDQARGGSPQTDTPIALPDRIEITADQRFLLKGRPQDMANIAGKRHSIEELRQRMLALPGVDDVWLDFDEAAGARIRGLLVASRPAREVLEDLAQSVDAAFLPRPLRRVTAIPRSDRGKVPLLEARALLERE